MAAGDIIITEKDVIIVPQEVHDHFGGEITHPSKPSKLSWSIDPDNEYIIGLNILNDPDWDYLDSENINGLPLMGYLQGRKKYKYIEQEL